VALDGSATGRSGPASSKSFGSIVIGAPPNH
jgi:hypothetical protein